MIISNTQITTYNSCTKQHDYMYTLGLGPRELSMPLYRGILGHSALETYYSLLAEGLPRDNATEAAWFVIQEELARIGREEVWNVEKLKEASVIANRIKAYSTVYSTEPFRIIAVEKQFLADFTSDVKFGFIPDLVVEATAGPYKGQLGIIDHKFVYNWKTVEELMLDAQLPKYRKGLQLNDYPVTWIMFNQIRTRDMNYKRPQDMFQRAYGIANPIASEQIWEEQMQTAIEIFYSPEHPPRRALAPMVCKTCFFKEPCMLSMNGQDVSRILEMDFQKRDRPFKEWYND